MIVVQNRGRLWIRLVSSALLLSITLVSGLPQRVAAAGPSSSAPVVNKVVSVEPDGTTVTRGTFAGAEMESRVKGDSIVTTIKVNDRTEVVTVDQNSPFFTVSVNGVTTTYDRRKYITKEIKYPVPAQPLDAKRDKFPIPFIKKLAGATAPSGSVGIMSVEQWLGSPYNGNFLGSRVQYDPKYVSAQCYENYSYYLTTYRSIAVAAGEWVSVVVGLLGLAWDGVIAILGSIISLAGAASYVISAVNVEKDSYRQDWFRYVKIDQDANGGIWYNAGRTRYVSRYVAIDGDTLNVQSDSSNTDFYDVSGLMQTAITNYTNQI